MIRMLLFCIGFFTAAVLVITVPSQWWGDTNIHTMPFWEFAVLLVLANFACRRICRDFTEWLKCIKILYRAKRRYRRRSLLPL